MGAHSPVEAVEVHVDGWLKKFANMNPVLLRGLAVSVLAALAGVGINVSTNLQDAIPGYVVAFAALVQAIITHPAVTPNKKVVTYLPDPTQPAMALDGAAAPIAEAAKPAPLAPQPAPIVVLSTTTQPNEVITTGFMKESTVPEDTDPTIPPATPLPDAQPETEPADSIEDVIPELPKSATDSDESPATDEVREDPCQTRPDEVVPLVDNGVQGSNA